ncbi:BUD16 [Candida oxycetoniae]|uniref:pyridoxal kinase n=1 Tax=Candida oxycetoniae TaxID=497107 RepID=A0AAI9WX42_9ASCO|nr:BUD16 [Candida oxycetoniae]KAI3403668.2 BUD16 [Candida oxycetoniae]
MKSVLSIQSHVVHGYAGGKAAIFPLQSQGWEVDNINTVHFSNHTGYGHFTGTTLSEKELNSIFDQLVNKLRLSYTAVLTGYIPNAKLIDCISRYIQEMKKNNPKLIYLFDPVMGDDGFIYVDKSCVLEYRNLISLGIVDLITPNQFELQLLTNEEINDRGSLYRAIDKLHSGCHIPYVVVTSVDGGVLGNKENDEKYIYCIISAKQQTAIFKIVKIESYFTGVGDLFSALLLDKFVGNGEIANEFERLSRSVNQVLTIVAKTLKLTHELGKQQAQAVCEDKKLNGCNKQSEIVSKMNDAETMKFFELKIIQARDFYSYDGMGEFCVFDQLK